MPIDLVPRSLSPDALPPSDADAERWVLGSIMLSPSVMDDLGFLKPEDFYTHAYQKMFAALRGLWDESRAIDTGLLAKRLANEPAFLDVGVITAITEVVQSVPTHYHAAHYARRVVDKAKYRYMRNVAERLWIESQAASDKHEDVLSRAESGLLAISTGQFSGEPVDLSQALLEALERMDELQDRNKAFGRASGLVDYDQIYGGFFPKELTIIAARPGIGKTAMATQIAMHNAERGRLVYFVSLEMSREELATRILCKQARVNNRVIRTGGLTSEQKARMAKECCVLAPARLKIHDRPSMTLMDIRRSARKLVKEGLSMVVVDYLQLVEPSDRKPPREQQVSAITRGLKQLARELAVPVLCLCQLNRQAEGERPKLSHLRESGSIEQEADQVLFLYSHDPSNAVNDDHNAVLEVAKYRHNELKCLRLLWDAPTTSFSCPEHGYPEFRNIPADTF